MQTITRDELQLIEKYHENNIVLKLGMYENAFS